MGEFSPILSFLRMTPSPELIQRCRKDDRKAHYELYSMCFSFLLSVCRRYYINREDMESALNHIFLKMVKNISAYDKKSDTVPFQLWVRRIAINFIIDEFRKNKKHHESLDYREIHEAEELHPVINPDVGSEQLEEILDAINQLPEVNRAVFNLFVVDGYKHEEIARMLNISPGTSKAHLHKAKKKLRDLLETEWKKKRTIHNVILQ
jgi:RNA polymerase sigma factor (sigma-70 family)